MLGRGGLLGASADQNTRRDQEADKPQTIASTISESHSSLGAGSTAIGAAPTTGTAGAINGSPRTRQPTYRTLQD